MIICQLTAIYYLGALLVSRRRILANIALLFAKRGETWIGDTWSQRTPVHARRRLYVSRIFCAHV